MITIVQRHDLPPMDMLLAASEAEGFTFVRRLVNGYQSGENRFAQPGEALFGAYATANQLVGVGGLNNDPYAATGETAVGRVRHFYVLPAWRRHGVGKALLQQIIAAARPHFALLTLRTFNPDADLFYRAAGFQLTPDRDNATHQLWLRQVEADF